MPPIIIALIVFAIAAAFVAWVWVYVLKRTDPPPLPDDVPELTDAEINAQYQAEGRRREAAQDRLFATIKADRAARLERQERNAQPYDTAQITVDAVMLVRGYMLDYDYYRALVYLLPAEPPPDDFDTLWAGRDRAIWSWQGDNLLEDYSEKALRDRMTDVFATMRGRLEVTGWQVVERSPVTDDWAWVHLQR